MRTPLGVLLVLLTIGLLGSPSFAQAGDEAADDDRIFSEVFDVTVASVEVYVTDKRERPVSGLKADDFELYVDGKLVDIVNFYAEAETVERPRASPRRAERNGQVEASVPTSRPVYLVVFFDDVNTRPGGRNRLLADLQGFLGERLGPTTEVLLARYDGSLKIIRPFSADRESLIEGLAEIKAQPALGNQWDRERRSAQQAVEFTYRTYEEAGLDPCVEGIHEMVNIGRSYGKALEDSSAVVLANLANMTSAVAGLDGRKALLYVGDGLPLRAGIDIFHFITEVCPVAERNVQPTFFEFDASQRFRELTTHANANGVTYFTLQASGLQAGSSASVDGFSRRFTPSPTNDSVRTANDQQGLFTLADDTGGRAVFNTNAFAEELDAISTEVRTLYSLGFEPPTSRNVGSDMWLKVKMRDRGLRVRHRQTFRLKPDDERIGERALGTLLFGQEQNPLAASVAVGEIERNDDETSNVILRVSVPADRLVFQPGDKSQVGRVRLLVTGRDATGRIFGVRQKIIPLSMADGSDEAQADGLSVFDIGLDLADGDYEVAVAVRDEVGITTSYLRHSFAVSDRAGSSEPTESN